MLKAENIQTLLQAIATKEYTSPVTLASTHSNNISQKTSRKNAAHQRITSVCLIDLQSGNLLAQYTNNNQEIPLCTLKLMCLLMKDKFYSDPKEKGPFLSTLHSSLHNDASPADNSKQVIYSQSYELDIDTKYNVCCARLPDESSLLICCISQESFEPGLLKMVAQGTVELFKDLWGYTFD